MKLPLAEISRRGVFKTLAAYTVAAWVLIEVISVMATAFLLPNWTVAAVTTILVLGAFPALLLSWHYEFSAEGIKRDSAHSSDEIDKVVKRVSAVLVIVLAGITAALWMNYFKAHSTNEIAAMQQAQEGAPKIGEDGRIRSIAVLPFEDYSEGTGRRLLADGIPEAILHLLAQNKELLVTARTSSFFFRDKDVTVSEIGRILNVEALLEGSIQVAGDRLRVTSQLVRTADQGHIWSNVYEVSIDDLFEIQDTIAATVRDLILVEASPFGDSELKVSHPNLEAYELLLEAKSLLDENSRDGADRSIALLRLAIEISPDYADAYAWLTMALSLKADILMEQRADSWRGVNDLFNEIEAAADKALELDADNAIAILQKGQFTQGSGGQGYEEAMQKALAVAPNDPDTLWWVSVLEIQQLDFQNARINLRRAATVDPGNFTILEGYIALFCGQEELVSIVTARLSNYSASAATAIRLRSQASLCDGRYTDSLTALTRLIRIDTEPASAISALQTLANFGDKDALILLNEAHKLVPGFFSEKPTFFGSTDLSIYFPDLTVDRIKTFRWHVGSGANPFFFMTPYSSLQIQSTDFSGAAGSLALARELWEDYYAYRAERVMSMDTVAIYALQAWVTKQHGGTQDSETIARELLEALEQRGLDKWSESRDLLQHVPLLILLLNGKEQEALKWLRGAEKDHWLGFQVVLASPMYEEFRAIPEVAEILSRLVDWRAGVLADLRALALSELVDPSLLLAKIESIIPPSEHHRANIALGIDRDYQAAARHFEKALTEKALDLDLLSDVLRLAYTLAQFETATVLAEFAVAEQPGEYGPHYELGFSHFWAGRWAQAIESFQNAQRLEQESTYLYRWVGIAKIMQGDAAGGMETMQELPDGWSRLVGLAIAHHALGQIDEADAALAELMANHGIWGAFNIAYVFAYRGDADRSFLWLQNAIDYNNRGLWSISFHPLFQNIHDDPRWLPLLRGLGVAPEQVAGVEFSVESSD